MTEGSPVRPVRFLVTGDVQVETDRDFNMLARDVERLQAMLADHEFLVLVGDLTMKGTAELFQRYRRVMAPIWDRTYQVFGGHDGLAEKPRRRSADLFRQYVGSPWRSWRTGGVHCLSLQTEPSWLGEGRGEEQIQWLSAELDQIAADVPLLVFCHIPPDEELRNLLHRAHRVLGVFYGHWHVTSAYTRGWTWYVCTGSQRGRDWGAGARRVRSVHVAGGEMTGRVLSLELPQPPAPRTLWTRPLGPIGQMVGSPAANHGQVYCPIADADVPHGDGGIARLCARTGDVDWHVRWPGGILGSPTLDGETVTALTDDGCVICWDRRDGRQRWRRVLYPEPLKHYWGHVQCLSGVVRFGRMLLVLGHEMPLVILDATTGRRIGQCDPPERVPVHMAAPVPIGNDFLLASRNVVTRRSWVTNEVIWQTPTEDTRVCSPAVVAGNRAFFTSDRFHAIDIVTGQVLWSRPTPQGTWALTPPVLDGDAVIATGREVRAMDQATGQIRWEFDPFADRPSLGFDPTVGGTYGFWTDGKQIVLGCDNGLVYSLQAADGRRRWSVDLGAPIKRPPIMTEDIVIAHDFLGHLHAVKPGDLQA